MRLGHAGVAVVLAYFWSWPNAPPTVSDGVPRPAARVVAHKGRLVVDSNPRLLLAQPGETPQTCVVRTQADQLTRNCSTPLTVNSFVAATLRRRAYSRQRSASALAAVDTFMTRRRSRFLHGDEVIVLVDHCALSSTASTTMSRPPPISDAATALPSAFSRKLLTEPLATQRSADCQTGNEVSRYAGIATGHPSRQPVVVAHDLGGTDGEVGAEFLFAEGSPNVHMRDSTAVRAGHARTQPGVQRLLAAVELLQRGWSTAARTRT